MIAPYRIMWLNKSSLDFDVYTELTFNSDSGATSSFLNRESVTTEHYDGTYRRVHSYKYNEVLTPRITIVKQNYSDFTQDENRQILSWLTGSRTASWLEVYHDDSNVVSYRLYGNFITVEQYKLANGRVVGYECEFESHSPYAWSKNFDITKQISAKDTFNIECNTDEYNKPIYPKVTITFQGKNPYLPIDVDPTKDLTYTMIPNVIYSYTKDNATKLYVSLNTTEDIGRYAIQELSKDTPASGDLMDYKYYYFPEENVIQKIITTKNSDGSVVYNWKAVSSISVAIKINNEYTFNGEVETQETVIAGGAIGETVVLDCQNRIISGMKNGVARIIGDNFNWKWVQFVAGTNTFTVIGNCTIKFEWVEPRKVGSM